MHDPRFYDPVRAASGPLFWSVTPKALAKFAMLHSSIFLEKDWSGTYLLPMPSRTSRLNANDWLKTGYKALAKSGPDALKAEPLAARMKVSKGSFYWHFRDVPAFHKALLQDWEQDAEDRLTRLTDTTDNSVAQLREMAQAFTKPGPSEPAIRSWAASYRPARDAVKRVDEKRLSRLQTLLSDSGIRNPEMAQILYASAIGMTATGDAAPSNRENAIGSLVDLVLALR